MKCEWTAHNLSQSFANKLFSSWKIVLHRRLPNSIVNFSLFQNVFLNLTIKLNFFVHIGVNYLNVILSQLFDFSSSLVFCCVFRIDGSRETFVENLSSILFIFFSKDVKLKSRLGFHEIIDIHKFLLFKNMMFICDKWSMLFQKIIENQVDPLLQLSLLLINRFGAVNNTSRYGPRIFACEGLFFIQVS